MQIIRVEVLKCQILNMLTYQKYNYKYFIHLHLCIYCILWVDWLSAWKMTRSDIQHL